MIGILRFLFQSLIGRLILVIALIVVVGGLAKLFRLDRIDICDNSVLINHLSGTTWSLKGGRQGIVFKDDLTFVLNRPFNNDGVGRYFGQYELVNDCHEVFPNAKSWDYKGVNARSVIIHFETRGELTNSTGMDVNIDFTNKRYAMFWLNGVNYLSTRKFKHLTKGD